MRLLFVLVIFSPCLFTQCAERSVPTQDNLGQIDFEVTGKADAQPHFKKGLLLLHSFEFTDAEEAFREAKSVDPDFVMAYWGEAMTHNHPLWRYQDKEAADSILNMLAATPEERVAKAKTEIEKDLIRGTDILFAEGTKISRDSSYAAYLGELYKKYPGNNEIASFYGLSLLASVPVGRDVATYEKAADIAKEVLTRNPEHPGALHYLIHAYDDPVHAKNALEAADAYAVVAPDAGHALHMPSHIYVASGLWDKVISSNEDAWAAGVARAKRKSLDNDAFNYHAFHWLQYGYLQKERNADALRLLHEMQDFYRELPSERAAEHLIYLKATYAVETEDYTLEDLSFQVEDDELNIVTQAMQDFINGMQAYFNGDATLLDSIITRMDAERLREAEVATGSARMCSGVSYQNSNPLDIQRAEVMSLELKGARAWMEQDALTTEKFLRQASELESSISYSYGPPEVVKPSWEFYGEWLLSNGRNKEALEQFELVLKAAPGRRLALRGKERAREVDS